MFGVNKKIALSLTALSLLLFGASAAEAVRVSPMVVELTSVGTGSTARIEVENTNSNAMPFEVRVLRMDFDDNGVVHETPADSDFLVFPPQGILAKNGRQVVRIQWIGGNLDSSRGYYVSINQLPVAVDASASNGKSIGASVQVLYHIKVLATVAPPGAQPKVEVATVKPVMIAPPPPPGQSEVAAPAGAFEPGIEITVRNAGKRYALMAGSTWTIEGTGLDHQPLKVVLTRDDLSHLLGAGYVPALGGQRTFKVPTGKAFGNAPIKVKFSA
jgi:fimbrial chaperone protein